jgi:hypothetical protein
MTDDSVLPPAGRLSFSTPLQLFGTTIALEINEFFQKQKGLS